MGSFFRFLVISLSMVIAGCQTSYAPWMKPKDGFYESTKDLNLEDAARRYLSDVGVAKGGYYVVYHSQIYPAFPYYERSQAGQVFTKLCEERRGVVFSDAVVKGLDPYASFKKVLRCDSRRFDNSGQLNVTYEGRNLYLSYSSWENLAADKERKALEVEEQRKADEAKRQAAEIERERKMEMCKRDTDRLRKEVAEGEYTRQGLVVEVKDKVVLIQTSGSAEWFNRASISSVHCLY